MPTACNPSRALPSRGTTKQVVYDFSNSAIALRRLFGPGFAFCQVLDLQLAFEALHGHVGTDAVSVLRAFGQQVSYSDVALRCALSCVAAFFRSRFFCHK